MCVYTHVHVHCTVYHNTFFRVTLVAHTGLVPTGSSPVPAPAPIPTPTIPTTPVTDEGLRITEIHYDNAGKMIDT
jgi:hypothetical protein